MLLLFLMIFGHFQIRSAELGLFEDLKFFKAENGYLIVGYRENGIALVDEGGQILGKYARSGEGPEELSWPTFLGVDNGDYLVLTHVSRVMKLSPDLTKVTMLNPLSEDLRKGIYLYGFEYKNRRYFVNSGLSTKSHLLFDMEFRDGNWKAVDRHFRQNWPENFDPQKMRVEDTRNNFKINVHNNTLFRSRLITDEEHIYKMEVFSSPRDNEPSFILTSSAEDLARVSPRFQDTRAFIGNGFATSSGFVVILEGRERQNQGELSTFADHFNAQGGFVKREEIDSAPMLCIDCPDVFEFGKSEGAEVIKKAIFD